MSSTALVPILNTRKQALNKEDIKEINTIYARRARVLKTMRDKDATETEKTDATRLVRVFNNKLIDFGVNPHG